VKRFAVVVAFLAATDLAVLLDIPVLRQLLGFSFFTFVPRILILYLLRLGRLGLTEKVVLSVGLSVSFLMLYGLFVNSASLLVGYDTPLSTVPVVVSFSLAVLVIGAVACVRNRTASFAGLSGLTLSTQEKAYLLLPATFPLLSVLGTRLMNVSDNNTMLLALLFTMGSYVVFLSMYRHSVPERLYPAVIVLMGISLLLMYSLRSSHLVISADTGREFYLFETTLASGYWSPIGLGNLDSCLSVSLLPATYQSFMDMPPEYLYKVLYSGLLWVCPLAVYVLSRKYIGAFGAFLASSFLMAQAPFLATPSLARGNTAILFFAMTLMMMFHDSIGAFSKRVLFIIFGASVIVSHYSTAYVFFFILLFTWLATLTINGVLRWWSKRRAASRGRGAVESLLTSGKATVQETPYVAVHFSKGISFAILALFFCMMFLWYSQVTRAPFSTGVEVLQETWANLRDFFLLEARSTTVASAFVGSAADKGVPNWTYLIANWTAIAFIAGGVLLMALRLGQAATGSKRTCVGSGILTGRVDAEHLGVSLACSAMLVLGVALPYVSIAYSLIRVSLQPMVVLAMYFVVGGVALPVATRSRSLWLVVLVLVAYFLCTTGALYEVFGRSNNVALNSDMEATATGIIRDQDSRAAKWLSETGTADETVYTGGYEPEILASQGGISPFRISQELVEAYEKGWDTQGYIYLGYLEVVGGEIIAYRSWGAERVDMTELAGALAGSNKVYASNGSEVYR